jgi:hypothetical protein
MDKKRAGPPTAAPVSRQGIRYEAIRGGKGRGLKQNGGYIAAVDEASGEEKWILKVYDVHYDKKMEADKQDVLITKLSFTKDGSELYVENERGKRFVVRLADQTVAEVAAG